MELVNSLDNTNLCHGDLHLENIIQADNSWSVIGPEGVIADPAFEASAFDFENDIQITELSDALEINPQRLISWIFLRNIISAQWFIDDQVTFPAIFRPS